MGNRTIYVRQGDETYWDRAEEMVGRQGTSMSKFLTGLIRQAVIDDASSTPVYLRKPADQELEDAMAEIRRVVEKLRAIEEPEP